MSRLGGKFRTAGEEIGGRSFCGGFEELRVES